MLSLQLVSQRWYSSFVLTGVAKGEGCAQEAPNEQQGQEAAHF